MPPAPEQEAAVPSSLIYRSPHDEPVSLADHAAVFVSGHAAARLWDAFYKRNAASFFRDRHYLEREWPLLGRALAEADARVEAAATATATTAAADPVSIFEAGCGAGNAVLPLLEAHSPGAVRAYACDFSPAAVELVRASAVGRAAASRGALVLWVADVAGNGREDDPTATNPLVGPGRAPKSGCDFVTYIFVLSALDPERAVVALRNAGAALKPGTGRLLVRDYAAGDLAQARLAGGGGAAGAAAAGTGLGGGGAAVAAAATAAPTATTATTPPASEERQRLSGRLYVRGDGTCAYYFEPQELADMALRAGLRVAPAEESSTRDGDGGNGGARVERTPCGVELVSRTVVNRASGSVMERRWLQAAFYRPAEEQEEDQWGAPTSTTTPTTTTSPQKKRARDEAEAPLQPPPQQQRPSAEESTAAAAVALARLRAPYCFRPLAGAGPPAPEFRSIELPSAAADGALLRWLALKSALPSSSPYASRLEGWAGEVAAALASAAASRRGAGGGQGDTASGGASVVVIPCPGDAPSHAAAALLALHAVRVGPEAARRAACAVLSAGAVGLGEGDDDDGGGGGDAAASQQAAEDEDEQQGGAAPDYEAQREHALRAYRLTLAANAPRAVFERVATWRLAPAPGEGSGREDPYAAVSGGVGCGPFDVAIALPAASPAASPALEAWRRRQQRRVLALAVGSGGGGGGGGEGEGACCCVLDFTRR